MKIEPHYQVLFNGLFIALIAEAIKKHNAVLTSAEQRSCGASE